MIPLLLAKKDEAFNIVSDPTQPLNFDAVIQYAKDVNVFDVHVATIVLGIIAVALLIVGIAVEWGNSDYAGEGIAGGLGITLFIILGIVALSIQGFHHDGKKRAIEYDVTRTWIAERYGISLTDSQINTLDPQAMNGESETLHNLVLGDGTTLQLHKDVGGFELAVQPALQYVKLAPGIPSRGEQIATDGSVRDIVGEVKEALEAAAKEDDK